MTEYHVGNYTYLYCLQWIKNDYRLTVPLPLWAENFYHLDAEFYLLRSGVGVGPLSRCVKMYPDSQHSCSHPSQAHSCFQAFVNDTGRPWRPQTSLVSKTESKSTVLFPPVFCFYHRRTVFCHLDSILLASENEHKQHLPWPGFPEECPLSICAKDAACMR